MIRLMLLGILLVSIEPPQETAKINGLLQRLKGADWMDQAKAATELRNIGDRALGPLAAAQLDNSPAVRYWAGAVSNAIKGRGETAPPPVAPRPQPVRAPRRDVNPAFNAASSDSGSVIFVCNNTRHGDYEVVISYCPVCAKRKRFSWDYSTKVIRCTVCKVAFTKHECNRCGMKRNPRRPAQIRPR